MTGFCTFHQAWNVKTCWSQLTEASQLCSCGHEICFAQICEKLHRGVKSCLLGMNYSWIWTGTVVSSLIIVCSTESIRWCGGSRCPVATVLVRSGHPCCSVTDRWLITSSLKQVIFMHHCTMLHAMYDIRTTGCYANIKCIWLLFFL